MAVTQLGYVGVGVTDMPLWSDIATKVIGLEQRSDCADGGAQLFRMDDMHHRIALHPADRDDILYAGWQVETEAEFDRLAKALGEAGAKPEVASAEDCAERRVQRLLRFRDPEGYANELYHRAHAEARPFRPGIPMAGFNTGPLGLGHIVRHCARYPDMVVFYRDVLGFRISDCIVWADADATFMRCNPRHHSLALLNESIGHVGGQTNHLMLELNSIDDVGRAYDEVMRRGLPIIMTLGRHSNDRTISFYFVSPSGFGIEIGTGGCLVEDESSWSVKTYDSTKIWGHLLPHERGETA